MPPGNGGLKRRRVNILCRKPYVPAPSLEKGGDLYYPKSHIHLTLAKKAMALVYLNPKAI
jgi:hypothetical protein